MAAFFGTIVAGLLVAIVMVAITDDQAFDDGVMAAAESAVDSVAALIGGDGAADGDEAEDRVPVPISADGDGDKVRARRNADSGPATGGTAPVRGGSPPRSGPAWTPKDAPPTMPAATPVASP